MIVVLAVIFPLICIAAGLAVIVAMIRFVSNIHRDLSKDLHGHD